MKTGDDLLTALANVAPIDRADWLRPRSLRLLSEAADLCRVSDADSLSKSELIQAIIDNF